jgi:hypothetical protein
MTEKLRSPSGTGSDFNNRTSLIEDPASPVEFTWKNESAPPVEDIVIALAHPTVRIVTK